MEFLKNVPQPPHDVRFCMINDEKKKYIKFQDTNERKNLRNSEFLSGRREGRRRIFLDLGPRAGERKRLDTP